MRTLITLHNYENEEVVAMIDPEIIISIIEHDVEPLIGTDKIVKKHTRVRAGVDWVWVSERATEVERLRREAHREARTNENKHIAVGDLIPGDDIMVSLGELLTNGEREEMRRYLTKIWPGREIRFALTGTMEKQGIEVLPAKQIRNQKS